MQDDISSATEQLRQSNRVLLVGIAAIVAILAVTAALLFANLPDANAFNTRVERIFVDNDALIAPAEIRLLEVLAQSGTAFSEVLASYRMIIFVLLAFSTALLIAALVFLVVILGLNRRMGTIQRQGIEVVSLVISRAENAVALNDFSFKLTPAAIETLSVLAEARMDGEVLSGAQIEAVISGRDPADCDEAAGATRIKRLRDALGNQLVSELLVRNIARKGYVLSVEKAAIRML
ncbi:winged helix-turn-helix domain-containing protein [Frigidibacter sp. MR17.24]|uniref:winged helix-turn-helix domain-containing protein n=1 Tax=Frigidibacter sp. MR17.24 TaxID=3127345 RepID=UPI003012EDF3